MSDSTIAVPEWTDETLRSLTSVGDLITSVGEVEKIGDVAGNGFVVLPTANKVQLVGVNFAIVTWRFAEGDNGDFASMLVITDKGDKLIVNDGSSGIFRQLQGLGRPRPLLVPGGLRVSEYDYTDERTGKTSKAQTFYLTV